MHACKCLKIDGPLAYCNKSEHSPQIHVYISKVFQRVHIECMISEFLYGKKFLFIHIKLKTKMSLKLLTEIEWITYF